MNSPKVSVIIPTFNRSEYLKECLESVVNQDYSNLEIVVTDDNSTDDTEKVVRKYKNKYLNIVYVRNTRYPKGPNGNKNNGLDFASGEILTILDDDDKLLFNSVITEMVSKLLEGYDMVIGNCIRSDNNKFSGRGINKSREVFYREYLCGKLSGEFFSIFKKNILKNKRFDIDLFGGEGTLWRGLWKNAKIYYIHKGFRWYRIHNSVSSQMIINLDKSIKNYERDIEYYGKEMQKYCPCYLATIYKGASYFAKLSGDLKKSFKYIFKAIGLCPKYFTAYIMLFINLLPKRFIPFLTKIRVKIKEKFEI